MSLINEALKKARTAQPTGRATATAGGPELHPVEDGGRARNNSIFSLPFVVALALMIAVIMLWAWHRAGRGELVVRANTPATAVSSTPFAVAPVAAPVTISQPMAATPVYRLDGIFFRLNRPSAVINGQVVYVGSRLAEARVTAIAKDSATIVTSAGQTNVLVLAN